MPMPRIAGIFYKLKDHGIKSLVIADEMPVNDETGYYLNWEDALIHGLGDWKNSGSQAVFVIKGPHPISSSTLRQVRSSLVKVGFDFRVTEQPELKPFERTSTPTPNKPGMIFISPQSLIQFAQAGVHKVEELLGHHRVLFIHGIVNLPYQTKLNRCFDSISFEWSTISTRIVRDVVAGRCNNNHLGKQRIFTGKWRAGKSRN